MSPVLGLIVAAAGGAEDVRSQVIVPLLEQGWAVAVTATPTAARWLEDCGELALIEKATGLPVRSQPRLPGEESPHPRLDGYLVAPASANTVAKLALGIMDNQALTSVNEAIGAAGLPVVVFPRVNAAHARHPSWEQHLASLRRGGVHLVYGDDVWPLHEPRSAPERGLPWGAVLAMTRRVIGRLSTS